MSVEVKVRQNEHFSFKMNVLRIERPSELMLTTSCRNIRNFDQIKICVLELAKNEKFVA